MKMIEQAIESQKSPYGHHQRSDGGELYIDLGLILGKLHPVTRIQPTYHIREYHRFPSRRPSGETIPFD